MKCDLLSVQAIPEFNFISMIHEILGPVFDSDDGGFIGLEFDVSKRNMFQCVDSRKHSVHKSIYFFLIFRPLVY